jgi:hypothetical protein
MSAQLEEAPPDYIRFLRDEAASDPMLKAEHDRLMKQRATASAAASPPTSRHGDAPPVMPGSGAEAFDAAAFDALPLPDKLDKAAHASLSFKMALIASTDVATASDARIRAALNAAQSIVLIKARIDEARFHAPLPDRSEEYRARWEKLKREGIGRASRADGQPVSGLIEVQAEET